MVKNVLLIHDLLVRNPYQLDHYSRLTVLLRGYDLLLLSWPVGKNAVVRTQQFCSLVMLHCNYSC